MAVLTYVLRLGGGVEPPEKAGLDRRFPVNTYSTLLAHSSFESCMQAADGDSVETKTTRVD